MNSFYTNEELKNFGFNSLGNNVLISRKSSIYHADMISIGNNVRIDDFCTLSAGINGIFIGNNVHIAIYSSIQGNGKVHLSDYCGLSSRVSIYSSTDDYSGEFMTNPTIPEKYTGVINGDVFLGKHVIVGAGSVILPNVRLEDGVAIGALSLVNKNCKKFYIYQGNPLKKIIQRNKTLLDLEIEYIKYSKF